MAHPPSPPPAGDARALVVEHIRRHGPITFADFMELALYHPVAGYYATASHRSGAGGDFYTSVDTGPMFGELLAARFRPMAERLLAEDAASGFDLVEAAAGNARLSRNILDALDAEAPHVYAATRLHLVERSPAARLAQAAALGRHLPRLASSGDALPSRLTGLIFANELLDALPVHAVVARATGLREVFVDVEDDDLVEREDAPSTPEIATLFARLGVHLAVGWRAEVNLRALEWIRQAARALVRGFLVIIDYGHEAAELYSATHAAGTLTTFSRHVARVRERAQRPPWLDRPGGADITCHVDFTSARLAAEQEGLTALPTVSQMEFLLGPDVEQRLRPSGDARRDLERRLAVKTLVVPGGLGTSHRVLVCSRAVSLP